MIHSPTHEFVLSLGVQRLIGNTGAARLEAGQTGVTTPLLLFGKGFGDLQVDALRPLAVTGSFGYAIADRKLKATPITGGDDDDPAGTVFNKGLENRWVGGVSVQYSLLYMDAEVRHLNLPDWMIGLTPIVEVLWSSPASRPSREGTQWLIAPGLIWSNENWQFGIEALIPGNRASGRNVGVIAQLKIGLGVIAPRLGRPLF
ncbi:hypothetical protein F1189_19955 [Rhodovastum atsumiense]|uniref:Uncharacterized protein n=1 Tax=Rhodovastum atsumiense TaxID=504468 RepID=A0A5M6IRQ8_9PROT|nr:hypothetical protein F1189_19955 [Rhodovastum atsumiense]